MTFLFGREAAALAPDAPPDPAWPAEGERWAGGPGGPALVLGTVRQRGTGAVLVVHRPHGGFGEPVWEPLDRFLAGHRPPAEREAADA